MTREDVAARLNKALADHFNSDGDSWGFSIGTPPDGLDDGDSINRHNFYIQITAPLKE